MQRLASKIRRRIIGTLYVDVGEGPSETIFLGGSGRSGTTWLSEVINFDNRYRYLFEPFHPRYVPEWSGFPERPYFRATDQPPGALEITRRILSGKIRNRWVDAYNTRLVGRQRLLKDVRANMFLKWLSVNFPEVPIVFALRHPCAVVRSQEKYQLSQGSWPPDLESLLAQPDLVEDHLEPFVPHIREACRMDLYDQLVFRWCIENYVPIRQFGDGRIHWLFYERACLEPETRIRELFSFIGRPWADGVLRVARRPSPMAAPDSSIRAGTGLIDDWQQKLPPERIERTVEILSLFGLDRIYGTDPLPRCEVPTLPA